jgi:TPR repeat protein
MSPNLKNSVRLAGALIVAAMLMSQSCRAEPPHALSDALIRYAKLDYAKAHQLLWPLADQGNAVAEEILGFMYVRGEGVQRDDAVAFHWFTLAAEAGRPEAQSELGRMYRDGVGVTADGKAALLWFRRAAEQGKTDACNSVGELYHLGSSGIPVDHTAALEWFFRAAERGSAEAMYNIGLRYVAGQGVERDEIEAFKWFVLAYGEAVGTLRDTAARARVGLAAHLMPMQVQTGLVRARDWVRVHRADEVQ